MCLSVFVVAADCPTDWILSGMMACFYTSMYFFACWSAPSTLDFFFYSYLFFPITLFGMSGPHAEHPEYATLHCMWMLGEQNGEREHALRVHAGQTNYTQQVALICNAHTVQTTEKSLVVKYFSVFQCERRRRTNVSYLVPHLNNKSIELHLRLEGMSWHQYLEIHMNTNVKKCTVHRRNHLIIYARVALFMHAIFILNRCR